MRMKSVLTGLAVVVLTGPSLAGQAVDSATVQALRQMAIEAGQASSSAAKAAAKSQEVIEAERDSIERHRAEWFARVYSSSALREAAGTEPSFVSTAGLEVPRSVDRETVQALRQLAVEAGQTSSSAAKPAAKSPEAIEAEARSIERHRVDFFARTYGDTSVM